MKFQSIELHNFGRFKGTHLFTTEITDAKNIILVKAMNDRGKTTFFNAIRFALYGTLVLPIKDLEEYVNREAMNESSGEMYVEVKFVHDDDDLRIKRSVSFEKTSPDGPSTITGNDEVTIFEADEPKLLKTREIQNRWIGHILPADASQFFFFDGEEIKRYIAKSSEKVKAAIEIVLGVKELFNSLEDLDKILNDFRRAYNKQLNTKTNNQTESNVLEELEEEIETLKSDHKNVKEEKSSAERIVENCDEELSKYTAIQNKVKERFDAESTLKDAKINRDYFINQLTEIRGYSGLLLLTPLLDIISNLNEDPQSFRIWESEAIQRLINEKSQKCICDRPLDENLLNFLSTKIVKSKQSKINILRKTASQLLIRENPKDKKRDFDDIIKKLSDIKQEISQWEDTIEGLDKEIGHSPEIGNTIKKLNDKRVNAHQSIGRLEGEIERIGNIIKEKENDLNKRREKLQNTINDKDLERAHKLVLFTEEIGKAIDLSIDVFKKTHISSIEKYISDVFKRLTNNPKMYDGLKLDEGYEIKVKRYDGSILPTYKYSPSAGASQIIATSLIAGLNKYTTRIAPVIIDTPLGRLDPMHRENMIKFYHELSRQVIILYQPGELNEKDIALFQNNIASEWEIRDQFNNPASSGITMEYSYI